MTMLGVFLAGFVLAFVVFSYGIGLLYLITIVRKVFVGGGSLRTRLRRFWSDIKDFPYGL